MNDNEVKNAFDHIEPEPGAQERIYANILKKAAAQREDQNVEENIEEKIENIINEDKVESIKPIIGEEETVKPRGRPRSNKNKTVIIK